MMDMQFQYCHKIALILSAGLLLSSAPVASREEMFIETVEGWDINKTLRNNDPLPCQMTHSYRDMTDGGAQNSVGITRSDGQIVFMLSYERWNWSEGESLKSDLITGNETISPVPTWIGKGTILYCRILDREVRKLSLSRTVFVRFPEGDADFDVSGIEVALAAMDRCNRSNTKNGMAR